MLSVISKSTRSRNPVTYNAKEDDELDESRSNGEAPSDHLEDDEFLKDEGRVGNVSAETKQNETTTIDASSINPSEDYIQMGGGFCADEAEIGDTHLENKATDDYRVMGGGFCADEDETGADDTEMLEPESEEHRNKAKRRNEEDASLEENVEIEIGNSSAGGLSAMPFLKRKKRKS